MPLKAYFQDVTPPAQTFPGLRSGMIVWHCAWAAAMLAGLLGLLFLPASPFVVAAMVAMTLPGVAVVMLLARDTLVMRRWLMVVWSLAALAAVALTGGITGPVAVWVAMPLVAALVMNQRVLITLGATLSCGVTVAAAMVSVFQRVHVPDDQEGFWLALIAIVTTVVGLSVALLPALRQRVERAADAEEARERLLKMLTEQPQLILCLDDQARVVAAYGEAPAGLDLGLLMQRGLSSAAHAPDRAALKQAVDLALGTGRADIGFMPHAAMDHYPAPDLAPRRRRPALRFAQRRHLAACPRSPARRRPRRRRPGQRGQDPVPGRMSHELRTPLNAVIGFSDIMRQQMFGELSPKYAEYAQLIWESGQHVLDLVNDVLDMSKIEAQKYQLSLESFDMREPVLQALRLMRGQAHEKAIDIVTALPQTALSVTADKRAIKQICLNLLSERHQVHAARRQGQPGPGPVRRQG
ncbi:MAG: histidine kinase dimerization/phospho-acceptor domain-containing protein [Asticcacaulis sp.]